MNRPSLVFTFFCCSILFTSVSLADFNTEDMRAFLLDGYTGAKSLFEDARIRIVTKSWHDLEWFRSIDPSLAKGLDSQNQGIEYSCYQYISKNNKERYAGYYGGYVEPTAEQIKAGLARIGTAESAFRICNNQCFLEYYTTKGSRDTTTQIGRAVLKRSEKPLIDTGFGPGEFLGLADSKYPDDILSSSELHIEPNPEQINGLLTYKVSAPMKLGTSPVHFTLWLSPERSCLPVRIETHTQDGSRIRSLEVKEFEKVKPDTWIIKEIVQKDYDPRADSSTSKEIARWSHRIEEIVLEPDIDEQVVFDTRPDNLPRGAVVQDMISGLEYVVGEGPVSSETIDNILERAIDDTGIKVGQASNTTADNNDTEGAMLPDKVAQSTGNANKELFSNKGINAEPGDMPASGIHRTWLVIAGVVLVGLLLLITKRFIF